MSFSAVTKDELAHIYPEKRCCQLAELAALVRMDGTITISQEHRVGLQVVTENAAIARKIFRLVKNLFDMAVEIRVQKRARLKKNNQYIVRVLPHPQMADFLRQIGIMRENGEIMADIKKTLISKQCCLRSFLRGVFLGAGSVNSPEGNYHLEIITNSLEYARSLVKIINRFPDLQAKISSRKKWHVVYLKEGEQIVAFLSLIGAHQALLNFENIRIVKGMRNLVNRLVNCETANLNKTVNASVKQMENIRLISQLIGLDKLPARLKNIAGLRLENPDVSLKELGEMMDPPVGKSGVNHRMRKIEEIADELRVKIKKTGKQK